MLLITVLSLAILALSREITFPAIAGVQKPLSNDESPDITPGLSMDISLPLFSGLMTYANLPYVHCLAGEDESVEKYDIAILGAPFDTVGRSCSAPQVHFNISSHSMIEEQCRRIIITAQKRKIAHSLPI